MIVSIARQSRRADSTISWSEWTRDALHPQHLLDRSLYRADNQRADNGWHGVEPATRLLEPLIPDEVRIDQDERVVFFQRALDLEARRRAADHRDPRRDQRRVSL